MADRDTAADRDGYAGTDVRAQPPPRSTVSRSVRRRMVARSATPRQAPTTPAAPTPTEAVAPAQTAAPAAPDEAATTDGTATDEAAPDRTIETADADRAYRRWRLILAGLCVLLAVAVIAVGLLGRNWYDKRQLDDAHQAAVAAARQSTVNFMSISTATVDRDIQRISAGATGDFRDEFNRDAAQVRKAVVDNQVTSQGTVLRTGLVSGNTRTAVVLVAVDANVKNKAAPNGRLSHYRVRVNLTHDAKTDRWLVSQLQFVG